MKFVFIVGFIFSSIIALTLLLLTEQISMSPQYESIIQVDKPEKIEYAISNAVNDVTSRNFVVYKLNVMFRRYDRKYTVKCCGVDKSRILNFGE